MSNRAEAGIFRQVNVLVAPHHELLIKALATKLRGDYLVKTFEENVVKGDERYENRVYDYMTDRQQVRGLPLEVDFDWLDSVSHSMSPERLKEYEAIKKDYEKIRLLRTEMRKAIYRYNHENEQGNYSKLSELMHNKYRACAEYFAYGTQLAGRWAVFQYHMEKERVNAN